jgi:predicted ArsR family transcriptional regulator
VSEPGTNAQSSNDVRQARAQGDSTRSRILRYLAESGGPVRVAAIAAHLGLNHNGVRRHLALLRDAGLVVEERATPGVPGRPPLEYRVAGPGTAGPASAGAYEELALLLLELRREGQSARDVGVEGGRRAVDRPRPGEESLERLLAEMARQGFEPEVRRKGRVIDLVAGRCAVETAAAADPGVVCEIHQGMIEGVLEASGGELVLRSTTRRDPSRAGCRFRIAPAERGGPGAL